MWLKVEVVGGEKGKEVKEEREMMKSKNRERWKGGNWKLHYGLFLFFHRTYSEVLQRYLVGL